MRMSMRVLTMITMMRTTIMTIRMMTVKVIS